MVMLKNIYHIRTETKTSHSARDGNGKTGYKIVQDAESMGNDNDYSMDNHEEVSGKNRNTIRLACNLRTFAAETPS